MPFDYTRSIKRLDRHVDKAWSSDMDPFECGIDIMGNCHGNGDHKCRNSVVDFDTMESICMVQKARDVEAQRDENQWLSSMLKYYWQNGIGLKGFAFLRKAGFVTPYRFAVPL